MLTYSGSRAAIIRRMFCCVADPVPEGNPPASMAGSFNISFAPGTSGDGPGLTFTGDLPMTITAPGAPEGFSIIDNGDGTFAYLYEDVAEGVYEFDIVAENAFGSLEIPTTVTVAMPNLWQEFALTCGNILDVYPGYVIAGALGNPETIGAIGPEPHPVFTARAILDGGPGEGYVIQLVGDCAAILDDMRFVIDGIECVNMSEAVYLEADNYTNLPVNSEDTPRWNVGETHYCQFVPA